MYMKRTLAAISALCLLIASCGGGSSRSEAIISSEPITLSYWVPLWYFEYDLESASELPLYQELERITGVTVDFIHPPYYDYEKPFAELVASGDLPDIVEANWQLQPFGAPEIAVSQGVIVPLEKGLQGYAPNLMRILESDPNLARYATDSSGRVFGFPGILPDGISRLEMGPLFRADWLDELEITVPETMEEWELTLESMKDFSTKGFGAQFGAPFVIPLIREPMVDGFSLEFLERSNLFAGAYGTSFGFFMGTSGIEYGPAIPEYRDMIVTLRRWYENGLINDYIASPVLPQFPFQELLASGSWVGPIREIWRLQPIKYIAAPYPRIETDTAASTGPYLRPPLDIASTAAVTSSCEYLVDAIRWLDFAYGERGNEIMNFGIPGTSFSARNTPPEFTDELMDDLSEKIKLGKIWEAEVGKYSRGLFGGPFVRSNALQEAVTELISPGSAETVVGWSARAVENPESILSLYPDTAIPFESVYAPIRAYRNEKLISFIIGETPIDLFDEYVFEMEKMGLRKSIQILDKCWDRHLEKPLPWS